METYTCQRILPSCILNRSLLAEIEKRLLNGIPRLLQQGLRKMVNGLGLESYKKLESYQILIETGKDSCMLASSRELANPWLPAQTRQVRMRYQLGGPRVISIELLFPQYGRPWLVLTTQSPQIEKILPKIADGLCAAIGNYRNRYKLLHNSIVQGLLLFSIPGMVMAYGLHQGGDLFLLYASMGWLCLLSFGLIMSLPRIFPWVTFATPRRFEWRRLPLLVKFACLAVAIGCYIGLILLSVPPAGQSSLIMLASSMG